MNRDIENKIKEFIPEKYLDEHLKSYITQAMRELARERAIGFAEWMVKRKVSPIGDNHWEDWGEADTENQIVPMRTTDQLYSKYIESQLKENK